MRTLDELIDAAEPGIDLLRAWSKQTDANPNVVLAPDLATRSAALLHFQVTTRSILGAVIRETGGLILQHGLLRVFGSGPSRSLLSVNRSLDKAKTGSLLLVADDSLGGLYALNGGIFGEEGLGEVFHLPADEMAWMPMTMRYSDFVLWCLTGNFSEFYGDLNDRIYADLSPPCDKVNSFYPPLWSKEGSRRDVNVRIIDADDGLRFKIALCGFKVER